MMITWDFWIQIGRHADLKTNISRRYLWSSLLRDSGAFLRGYSSQRKRQIGLYILYGFDTLDNL